MRTPFSSWPGIRGRDVESAFRVETGAAVPTADDDGDVIAVDRGLGASVV
jgi:hypothetical protein